MDDGSTPYRTYADRFCLSDYFSLSLPLIASKDKRQTITPSITFLHCISVKQTKKLLFEEMVSCRCVWFVTLFGSVVSSMAFMSEPSLNKSRFSFGINGKSLVPEGKADTAKSINEETEIKRTVTILERGPHHIVASKPHAVVCHHSGWTGSRSKVKKGEEPEIPMLQRVRDGVHSIEIVENEEAVLRKVNLVHRLDRGASGALLFAFADEVEDCENDSAEIQPKPEKKVKGATATLIDAMSSSTATKTYIALVRGEGILHGEDLKERGWFEVNRPIKNEKGTLNDATTLFRFIASQAESKDEDGGTRPRVSLILARPLTGRWHQIRRHLNGISHPILGDTSHGGNKANKDWRQRNMLGERTCLHLSRLQLPPTKFTPDGIDVGCPLPEDMLNMMKVHAPDLLKEAEPFFNSEGILVEGGEFEVGEYQIPQELLETQSHAKQLKNLDILIQTDSFVVVAKPPGVVCHHSAWTGKRHETKRRKEPTPMLQRVRDVTGKKVNLVHRLDRSVSGCLMCTFADTKEQPCQKTRTMIESMQSDEAVKTYIAICDGDGTWKGENFLEKGWFLVDTPIKDENGKIVLNAKTEFKFIAGKTLIEGEEEGNEGSFASKAAIVLARPKTGKWHQIRQHLSSGKIGHNIIGDSSHGFARVNRAWKKEKHLTKERTCLHLARLQIPQNELVPSGTDITSPLPEDLIKILDSIPDLHTDAIPLLKEEGIYL